MEAYEGNHHSDSIPLTELVRTGAEGFEGLRANHAPINGNGQSIREFYNEVPKSIKPSGRRAMNYRDQTPLDEDCLLTGEDIEFFEGFIEREAERARKFKINRGWNICKNADVCAGALEGKKFDKTCYNTPGGCGELIYTEKAYKDGRLN